jgi:hypothetical protein
VLQFYPSSDDQIQLITSIAQKAGFGGGLVVDYPNSKKAKKIFLCLFVGAGSRAQALPQGLTGDVEEDAGTVKFEKRRERQHAKSKGQKKGVKDKDWILKKKEVRASSVAADVCSCLHGAALPEEGQRGCAERLQVHRAKAQSNILVAMYAFYWPMLDVYVSGIPWLLLALLVFPLMLLSFPLSPFLPSVLALKRTMQSKSEIIIMSMCAYYHLCIRRHRLPTCLNGLGGRASDEDALQRGHTQRPSTFQPLSHEFLQLLGESWDQIRGLGVGVELREQVACLRRRRVTHEHGEIDAPGPDECGVELLGMVRRHEDDSLLAGSHAVEGVQEAGECYRGLVPERNGSVRRSMKTEHTTCPSSLVCTRLLKAASTSSMSTKLRSGAFERRWFNLSSPRPRSDKLRRQIS